MGEVALLPCPFCGSAPRVTGKGSHGEPETMIFCVCPPEPTVMVDGINNLTEAGPRWNTRAEVNPTGVAFVAAALEYCRVWTRDARNAHDPVAVGSELSIARGKLYAAYRALKEGL